jgi:hypothetical protein
MNIDSLDCELCLMQKEEKLKRHLFFKCLFARNCWNQIGVVVPTWIKAERATKKHQTSNQLTICYGHNHSNALEHLD